MAHIQTTVRLIKVKESINELHKDLHFITATSFLFEVTEDTSFYGELSQKTHQGERKILINVKHIVEILP